METGSNQIAFHILSVMRIVNIRTACANGLRDKFGTPFLTMSAGMLASIRNGAICIPHNVFLVN